MSKQTTIFQDYIDKYFGRVINKITELYNGRPKEQQYTHERLLDKEYSSDLTWNSVAFNNSIVAADVVSMDSSLPLKKRATISTAAGDITKIGMKYLLKEKDISNINIMRSKGQNEAAIANKILQNAPRAIKGVKTRVEILFQQGLSQGMVLVSNENNDGTGVRADFGYLEDHTFHAIAAAWTDATNATPLDDIRQMFAKAEEDGNEINYVFISDTYLNLARKTDQIKELVANSKNQVIISAATLPNPGRSDTLNALKDEFNAEFIVMGDSYRIEKADGSYTSIKPWAAGNLIGLNSEKVGRLMWGTLAEETNPVSGVTYEKSDYILVSEYSMNEPSLVEITSAQALAFPVIDNVEEIYILHADGTGNISTDVDSLSFASSANNTGKRVTVTHADKSWTAAVPVADSWATVTTSGNVITVKVSANTGSGATQRTTTLTITDADGNKKEVTITQAA